MSRMQSKNTKYPTSFCSVFKLSLKPTKNKDKRLPNATFRHHCDAIVNSGESEDHVQYSSALLAYSFRRVSLCSCILVLALLLHIFADRDEIKPGNSKL